MKFKMENTHATDKKHDGKLGVIFRTNAVTAGTSLVAIKYYELLHII